MAGLGGTRLGAGTHSSEPTESYELPALPWPRCLCSILSLAPCFAAGLICRGHLYFCGVDTLALNKWRVRCRVLTYSVQTGSNKIFELPVEFPSLPPLSAALHLAETRLCCTAVLVQRLSHPQEAERGGRNSWELCRAV